MATRSKAYLKSLVRELAKMPDETEWVEFKCGNKDPDRIAKYISGLSNAALLEDKPKAYIVWGVDDKTHEVVGTDFNYHRAKRGSEELEAWLAKMTNPSIPFKFHEVPMDEGVNVVLLEIPCAEREPTRFGGTAYIRIGSNLKPLLEYPEIEAELWRKFDTLPHELRTAAENLTEDEMMMHLDTGRYYDLLEQPLPRNRDKILDDFMSEKFIKKNDAGGWDITNLGMLMIGKNLKSVESLLKRSVRVINYKGNNRLEGVREREFTGGYAFSHEEIVQYIMAVIPQEEVIDGTIRHSVVSFPEIAIRELLANCMIHQALDQRGTNPMVEIFDDRIEFSNAGAPLVAIDRIIDTVPVSRNENMAGFMHKCGICEERGSGFDKVVAATSKNAMLAPRIENQNNQFTKAVLFSKVPFDITTKADRVRTCYMQACLAYVNFGTIDNGTMRDLFGLDAAENYKASRIIKDTITAGLIKPLDENTAPRYMKYIPHWA